jgi:hypothetical protein
MVNAVGSTGRQWAAKVIGKQIASIMAVAGVLFEGEGGYSTRELIIVQDQVGEPSQCPKRRRYSALELIIVEAQYGERS